MRLELASYDIKDVVFSDSDTLVDGVLHVDKAALLDHLAQVSPFEALDVDIARPGESVRIVHALDVVEPRGPKRRVPDVSSQASWALPSARAKAGPCAWEGWRWWVWRSPSPERTTGPSGKA